jgi:Flp pilus assembly protein TadG
MPIRTAVFRTRPHRRHADRRGATLVEFAIVAPVMFMLIFACIELARVFMMQSIAEDAAYEAARHCMVSGAQKGDAITEANGLLALLGTQNATVTVTAVGDGTEQAEIDDDTDEVTVNISIPMADNTLFLSRFTGTITLDAEVTLMTERYKGFYDEF